MQFDKRRLARIGAVVVVALAAGHLVQTLAARKALAVSAVTEVQMPRPASVVLLAGTNEAVTPPVLSKPALPPTAMKVPPVAPAGVPIAVADPCPITLDLMADPGAMIGVTLLAPCQPSARVVLRHAGLAVTAQTSLTGTLFLSIPAMTADAGVEVWFGDGKKVAQTVAVSDMPAVRRFAVQWQGDDAFQLFGQESNTVVSAANPGVAPQTSQPASGGFLTRLGDGAVTAPLFAEIYTFPASASTDVVVEAAVTPATCGRELLGETLLSRGGQVTITDLTLAMPECDAVGDFLVLNNLVPDLTLASAN